MVEGFDPDSSLLGSFQIGRFSMLSMPATAREARISRMKAKATMAILYSNGMLENQST